MAALRAALKKQSAAGEFGWWGSAPPTSPIPPAMRSPAPPELAAGSSIADWDLVPLTFYVALPSMLRETLTLDRDVTVGNVKEIIEFLTLIKVQEQHLFHSAIEGFKKLQDDTKTLRDVGLTTCDTLVLYGQCERRDADRCTFHLPPHTLFTAYEDPSESASGASIPGASIPLAPAE